MRLHLNPALAAHPREAAIVGRLLPGFGELEYILCKAAAECRDNPFSIMRALYRINGTTARIDAADALTREIYLEAGMGSAFADAIGALRICLRIRNQYAHCTWATGHKGRHGGLYFADLSVTAEASGGWSHHWRHVNVKLLKEQEAYFEYAKALLFHIETGATPWRNAQHPVFPKPPKTEPPRMHNPPEAHIPPWLSEVERQIHLEAALAAKETVRSQERARLGQMPARKKKPSARMVRERKARAARRKRRLAQRP